MDVAGLAATAVGAAQVQFQQQVSVAVAKKAIDNTEQQGSDLLKLMGSVATPGLGENVDISA